MTIPRKQGESSVLWEADDSRIRIECHGDTWTIHTEYCDGEGDDGEPTYIDGPIPLSGLMSPWWTTIMLGLRGVSTNVAQFLMITTKGSTKMPAPGKPIKVARDRGWWVEFTGEAGSDEMLIGVKMKRPLSADEMVAFLDKFTKWATVQKDEQA